MTVILEGNDTNDSYINEAFTPQPYIHAEQNKVIMKWNETINKCSYMFSGIPLKSIDLSQFDTSEVV